MMSTISTVLILLFPGVLLSFRKQFFPLLSPLEKIPVYIAVSLAYWILGFWWLRYIPIPFNAWIIGTIGVSAAIYAFLRITKHTSSDNRIPISPWTWLFCAIILMPEIIIATQLIAPSGQDMSMHAYIANIIVHKNTFPEALTPLIPVNQFGLYPFGFSTIIAVLTVLNRLPIFTNALFATAIVHTLFDAALYVLLRSKFSPRISMIVAIIVAWSSHNPHLFVEWGANPSVLSMTFLIFSIALFHEPKAKEIILVSVYLAAASMMTNYMYVITLGYILMGVLLVSIPHIPRLFTRVNVRRMQWGLLTAVILLSPFFSLYASYHGFTISEPISRYIQGLHRNETSLWNGTFTLSGFWGISEVIAETIDHKVLALYALCVLLLFKKEKRTAYIHSATMLMMMLLVANARFWWLPFSSILYPQRIALILLIPISWAIAHTIHTYRSEKHGLFPTVIGCTLIILMILQLRQFQFTKTARDHQLVTPNDIAVLTWLKQHSKESDIIWNRYEDAGVWIPAIIYRPITLYHTNPVDKLTLLTVERPDPRFAFIGETVLQKGNIQDLVMETYPSASTWKFDLLYSQGNAAVYRIDQ